MTQATSRELQFTIGQLCDRVTAADDKIKGALETARDGAGFDGAHHKDWVIDQMVRALTGDGYTDWVKAWEDGEDGPNTYEWQTGIAP